MSLADGLDRGLDDARSLLAELRRRTMPADDLVDGQQHWCTPEFGWDELQAYDRLFWLSQRFVIIPESD